MTTKIVSKFEKWDCLILGCSFFSLIPYFNYWFISFIILSAILFFLPANPENITVKMPTKKPKGKELTPEQKQKNKEISSFRILVEHAIGGVKRCRIVKERLSIIYSQR